MRDCLFRGTKCDQCDERQLCLVEAVLELLWTHTGAGPWPETVLRWETRGPRGLATLTWNAGESPYLLRPEPPSLFFNQLVLFPQNVFVQTPEGWVIVQVETGSAMALKASLVLPAVEAAIMCARCKRN